MVRRVHEDWINSHALQQFMASHLDGEVTREAVCILDKHDAHAIGGDAI
jgi:hypothetical protein